MSEQNIGIKDTKEKLFYELSWEFIEEMARQMAANKGDKYPLFNWQKPIDPEQLKQAITRHFIELQKGNLHDDREFGHILALACNSMMLWYQYKYNEEHNNV